MEWQAGRWTLRLGAAADEALALRAQVFRDGASDGDRWDALSEHLTIADSGGVAACARLRLLDGAVLADSYTGAAYDLGGLAATFPRVVEVGRVALMPGRAEPDLPRLILAVLARRVVDGDAAALIGCGSLPGCGTGLGRLAAHVAPAAWCPRPLAAETRALDGPDGPLPPLMRGYLALGAKVSDRAVVDRDLGTCHVFTALPRAAIPEGRARMLAGMLPA